MSCFIDTNYFLRFLLKDHPEQQTVVAKLFEEGLEGKTELFTSLVVFFEIYWVLSSFYNQAKQNISLLLKDLLALDFILLTEKPILISALELYEKSNLNLEDCYNLFYAKQKGDKVRFGSFDKDAIKKFEAIMKRE